MRLGWVKVASLIVVGAGLALATGPIIGFVLIVFTATPLLTYLQERAPMSRVKKEKVVREPDDSGAVI